jgi:hypothetical protein
VIRFGHLTALGCPSGATCSFTSALRFRFAATLSSQPFTENLTYKIASCGSGSNQGVGNLSIDDHAT